MKTLKYLYGKAKSMASYLYNKAKELLGYGDSESDKKGKSKAKSKAKVKPKAKSQYFMDVLPRFVFAIVAFYLAFDFLSTWFFRTWKRFHWLDLLIWT